MSITAPVQHLVPATRGLAAAITEKLADQKNAAVVIGPQRQVLPDDVVLVAAPSDTGAGVLIETDPADQGNSQTWAFEIIVVIATWSGDLDVDARLTRVQELLDLVVEAVMENHTLPYRGEDTVSTAAIGSQGQLAIFNGEDGIAAEIGLTVRCEVF